MKIIFFGTSGYVIPAVAALYKTYNKGLNKGLIGVVTQNPRPVGRKKIIIRSAVDNWAYKHNIAVFYNFDNLPEADLGILAAYGEIIPQKVIDSFKYGIINIHPSLLPEFRGASPIQAALVSGKKETGVSVIKLDNQLDHGPVVSQFTEEIWENDTTESLRKRLFERSSEFLIDLIPNYLNGKINLKEQNHKKATFTKIIKKEDGFIPAKYLVLALEGKSAKESWKINFINDFSLTADPFDLERFIRAMYPWPIAWTLLSQGDGGQASKRLKIIKAHVEDKKLILGEVQLEGKNRVTWKQFKEGYPEAKFEV